MSTAQAARPALDLAQVVSHLLVEAQRRATPSSARWLRLQAAHVAGQGVFGLHVRVHAAMLRQAVLDRNGAEVAGQLLRLAVLPMGHLTGRLPWGNTGRSDVNAFRPMQPPEPVLAVLAETRLALASQAAPASIQAAWLPDAADEPEAGRHR